MINFKPEPSVEPNAPLLTAGVRYVKPCLIDLFVLTNGSNVIFVLWRSQRDDEVDNPAAHFRVANAKEGTVELEPFRRGEEGDVEGLRAGIGEAAVS